MIIFVVLGLLIWLTISSVFGGWVLSLLWGWFMVPVFHLPQLTIVPAIGIILIVRYLASGVEIDDEKGEGLDKKVKKFLRRLYLSIVRIAIVLLFGWIVHFFM